MRVLNRKVVLYTGKKSNIVHGKDCNFSDFTSVFKLKFFLFEYQYTIIYNCQWEDYFMTWNNKC